MKILHVISSFPPAYSYGGAPRVAYDISREFVRRGHEVSVFTTDAYDEHSRLAYYENPMMMEGVEVSHFRNISNRLTRRNLPIALSMRSVLKSEIGKFDIVHLHEYRSYQAIIVHKFAVRERVPYILQAHGSVMPIFERKMSKELYDLLWGKRELREMTKAIAVSRAEIRQYKQMGIEDNRIALIPNPVDLERQEDDILEDDLKRRLEIPEDYKIVLFLGRLHRIKGIDFLIKSFKLLTKDFEDVVLIIAGPDAGFRSEADRLVEQLRLEKKVFFLGFVKNTKTILNAANIVVYPSIFEIFGLVPFDALISGKPVIVAEECGCGEIIKEARAGLLVKYNDYADLYGKMKQLLVDETAGRLMVERGREYILQNLSIQRIASKVENVYEECIKGQ